MGGDGAKGEVGGVLEDQNIFPKSNFEALNRKRVCLCVSVWGRALVSKTENLTCFHIMGSFYSRGMVAGKPHYAMLSR